MLLNYLDTLNNEKRIVLASGSSMRKKILEQVGLTNFVISPSGFAEDLPKSDFATSIDYVIKTSEVKLHEKARELKDQVAAGAPKTDILIAADTIVSFEDREVIEKAADAQHAFDMLKSHIERGSHQVYTSVWIAFLNEETQEIQHVKNFVEKTTVYFYQGMTDEMIWKYVQSGEPFGKAGGYGAQTQGATFIERFDGCFYNVLGFPIFRFCQTLMSMLQPTDTS